jgi:predicted nucleic acid-binding protein
VNGCLVDATVWAAYLRGGRPDVRERVDKLLDGNRAVACGVVLAALLSAIDDEHDRRFIEECLRGVPFLESGRDAFAAAGRMAAALRRRGEAAPIADLLLLALAREHRLTLFTLGDRLAALARAQGVALESPPEAKPAAPGRAARSASQQGG